MPDDRRAAEQHIMARAWAFARDMEKEALADAIRAAFPHQVQEYLDLCCDAAGEPLDG